MEVSLHIENGDLLEKIFRKAPTIAAKEYGHALEKVAIKVTSDAIKAAPVGKYAGGGSLRQSIQYRPHGGNGFKVMVNSSYGVFVDQGTRPHVIVPRRKKMLAFQKDGRWIFAKRVNHPGTKAQPFFTNAVEGSESYANTQLKKAMDNIIDKL